MIHGKGAESEFIAGYIGGIAEQMGVHEVVERLKWEVMLTR